MKIKNRSWFPKTTLGIWETIAVTIENIDIKKIENIKIEFKLVLIMI